MISYKAFLGALIAFSSYTAAQDSVSASATCGVNEGTASFSCHSDCGNAIVHARDTCAYDKDCVCDPDGTFIQNMPNCLACGATLWQWYGSYLEPALELCEMQTTPDGYLPPCPETSTEESSSSSVEDVISSSIVSSSEVESSSTEIVSSSIESSTAESAAASSSTEILASSTESSTTENVLSSSESSTSVEVSSSIDVGSSVEISSVSSTDEVVESSGPTCGVNEGTASFSCHSDCGNAIVYARDTCAYDKDCVCDPDGTFIQNMPNCLACGATLWQWYGSYLEPALELCEMQTTPDGYLPPCPETSTEESSSSSIEDVISSGTISSSEIESSSTENSSSSIELSSTEIVTSSTESSTTEDVLSSSESSTSVEVSSSIDVGSSVEISSVSSTDEVVESSGPTCGVNEGTASFSCHSDCGNAIVHARDTCAYDKDCVCDPDGTFIQNMPNCLACGATLWQWYGSYLEPALELCEMQTTPDGYLPPCPETSTEESSSSSVEDVISSSIVSSSEVESSSTEIVSSSIESSTAESAAASSSTEILASSTESSTTEDVLSSSESSTSVEVSSSIDAGSSVEISSVSSTDEVVESSGPTCGVNEGTASFSCHSDCGNAIVYARDTCAYDKDCVCDPDGTFIQNMPNCLACGATLWQWYGSYLEPALELCEMQTTPDGYLPPCPETSTEESSSSSVEDVISSGTISSSEVESSSTIIDASSTAESAVSTSVEVSSSPIDAGLSVEISSVSSTDNEAESTGSTCGVNEGTASFSCHSDCGNAIVYARDTCSYDKDCVCNPDGAFIQNMPNCLACGATLWQWYGSYLEPALELCEMQTTPDGYLPPCSETSSSSSETGATSAEVTASDAGVSNVDSVITSTYSSDNEAESTGPTCGVNEGTASFSCHSDCGNAIVYARDTCAYNKDCVCNPDGAFIQNMPNCLACGATLWQWYGSYLEPALELCEMQTTPDGYLPSCSKTSTESDEIVTSESLDVESASISLAPVISSPTISESASSVVSESESSSTPIVDPIIQSIIDAILQASFSADASEKISIFIQIFIDAIGQALNQLYAVLFDRRTILKRASSIEGAITTFSVFTSTLNQWFAESSYDEFLQGISQIHTYATPSEVEANVRSALASTLEAAQSTINDFISQSEEFKTVSENFYDAFNKLVAEVIDALYPDSTSTSSAEISPEASSSADASESVSASESATVSAAESKSESVAAAESESDANSASAVESESAAAAASAEASESAAVSDAEFESAAISAGVSNDSRLAAGTTTLRNTVTKFTTVVKTQGTVTTTITEPCETTTETVVIEPTTTYTITETCNVCKTHTTVESGVTTITKTSGTEIVTVTEPCETTYTVVESPVTSDSVVKTVTSTIVKTVSSSEIPVTVTETCSVCKTHTTVESGVTTITKTSGTEIVTVTEPCETTYTVVESPVTSDSVVKTVTSTIVKTVSSSEIPVTVTETCSVCKTHTTVESGVTTITKTSGTEIVTVTEPCETTYTMVESPVSSESMAKTITSTISKIVSVSSAPEASKPATVTNVCTDCKTQLTTATGVTTHTSVSEGATVTVTEPCETTYEVVESPSTSAGSTTIITLTSVITSKIVTVTSSDTVVTSVPPSSVTPVLSSSASPVPSGSAAPVPSEGSSHIPEGSTESSQSTPTKSIQTIEQAPPASSTNPVIEQVNSGVSTSVHMITLVLGVITVFFI
ncbi:uncharacterized protein SAPINGB_P005829 [Magnusiomyces paraingens]|uniref:Uncharacterized protein n=1 Tax=Magnusiomyces paraingens TaxID=2606893 RepID=A0A5E8C8T4_9ASCO|nr:uncharacterized protein SAPINGB_P005829 [Saprochaete ingens]VVT57706.1 unnamed protein product [Saprochaete ingens]